MSNSAAVWNEVVSFEALESKLEHRKISSFAEFWKRDLRTMQEEWGNLRELAEKRAEKGSWETH